MEKEVSLCNLKIMFLGSQLQASFNLRIMFKIKGVYSKLL